MNVRHLFAHWDTVRRDLFRPLDQLNDDQLHFVPKEGLWNLGQVVCHIASGEEHWFQHYIHGRFPEPRGDYRLEDFASIPQLKLLLTEVHARTEAFLETLDIYDLEREVHLPWGVTATVGYAVWHILEHEVHHRGEIFLMLGLLGLRGPDI